MRINVIMNDLHMVREQSARSGLNARARSLDPRVSVILPVLNEQERIGTQLTRLLAMRSLDEVIVVDGGSTDRTVEIVRAFPDVRLLTSERGRARQMNTGATAAAGDILLFLHADVTLPIDAAEWVRDTLSDPDVIVGAFRTWTVPDRGRSRLALLLHLADLRSRYTSLPYGDQAVFMQAEAFRAHGGFREIPLMEDLELVRRLRRTGRVRTVPASVVVSGRRLLARPLYYMFLMNLFPLLFRLGMSPRALAALYGNPR